MKSFSLQFIFAGMLMYIVLNVAEAPEGKMIEIETPSEKEIVVAFVGDMMLGRNVEVLMERDGKDYPFDFTSEIFNKADFVIGNLEGPIPRAHMHTKVGEMSFSFPAYIPRLLYKHGVHAVSLANNHTYDKGKAVYDETVAALQGAQIGVFGHPLIQSASYAQHYVMHDVPFTLIGFNATFPSFNLEDALTAVQQVKMAYPQGELIALMHWGDEYELASNDTQKDISQKLHASGVDLVIGSHPHVVQEISCNGIEQCTIYSLGNFIFDQYFSQDVEEGLVAFVTLDSDSIKRIEILPIDGNHSQPEIMPENKDFMAKLIQRSMISRVSLSTSSESLVLKP